MEDYERGLGDQTKTEVELGTRYPEMMLLPYKRLPATGSLIPSMSTGGAMRILVN